MMDLIAIGDNYSYAIDSPVNQTNYIPERQFRH